MASIDDAGACRANGRVVGKELFNQASISEEHRGWNVWCRLQGKAVGFKDVEIDNTGGPVDVSPIDVLSSTTSANP
jgi:hypothetical protein